METADCEVRRANPPEALVIADLWLRSRRAAVGIPPSIHGDEEIRLWVRDLLFPSTEVWVATEDGQVAGMMALREEWIEQLYISPEHQRRGHGARLLEVAKAKRDSLRLWAFETNLRARRFYEAHGFTPAGSPSSDNEEGAPAILYRWRRAISEVESQPS